MSRPRWLTRNLLVLTAVSFTQDAASELVYPLLPVLVVGVLAAPPAVLGVVEGTAEAVAGLTRYVAGRMSDRVGRKPLTSFGYLLAAVGKVLVAAATVWPAVLVGRTVDRFGKGVRSAPRDAWIAASVPSDSLGRAFGFHRTGDTLGAVVGPLLGLLALGLLDDDVRSVLWVAVIPAVLSALLVFLGTEPPRPARSRAPRQRTRSMRSPLPRRFWRVTTVLVLIALVNVPDALLLLRLGDVGMSLPQTILAYAAFNLVYAAVAYPAGSLSDRLPRSTVYGLGLVAFACCYVGLGLTDGGWVAFALFAMYGLFPGLTDGVGKAWISSMVDDHLRGRAQGVFQALMNGAVFVAGLWAGLLWTAGPGRGAVPLVVAGAGAAVAAVGLLVVVPALRRRTA